MGAFEYRQAEEIRDAFARHGVRYLFIGKSGAILLGFPDTTQDADLFVEKSPGNGRAIVAALRELGFDVDDEQAAQIERGKDFVQLKNGPFDLDLVFAPDGIERFADAWRRHVEVEGFYVCHPDDIIASKEARPREGPRVSTSVAVVPRVLDATARPLLSGRFNRSDRDPAHRSQLDTVMCTGYGGRAGCPIVKCLAPTALPRTFDEHTTLQLRVCKPPGA